MLPALLVLHLVAFLFLGFPCSVVSQNYTIPSEWQGTTSSLSRADRQRIASNAASVLQSKINPTTGFPRDTVVGSDDPSNRSVANMVVVLATQDWRSGGNSWKAQVVDNTLAIYESGQQDLNNGLQNIDTATFGLAEIAAYLAYGKNSSRLEIAQRNFDMIYVDFITPIAAQNGTYSRPLNTTCGSTLGGAVFYQHDPVTDTSIHGSGAGAWVALAARLYEITGNSTYLRAAEQTIQFVQTYMVNMSDPGGIICGMLYPASCKPPGPGGATDDAGFYIEGLSIVANLTANQTYTQTLDQLVPAMVALPGWHNNSGGILIEDNHRCSKGIFIRGLLEARLRNPSNTGLVALIDSYLTVQFNAIRARAYLSDNDYAQSWYQQVSSAVYTTVGQIDALDVLNSAFAIAPVAANVPSTPVTRPPEAHSLPIGIIIGATVGGAVAIAAFALVLCIRLRRRRRRAREMPICDDITDTTSEICLTPREVFGLAEPYILPAPAHDRPFSPPQKGQGGSQQRVPLLRDYSDNSPSTSLTNPFLDPPISHLDGSNAQIRPVNGDSDAQEALERSRMLERRLDDLMHSLARRGETESIPPEYDGDVIDRASGQEERDE